MFRTHSQCRSSEYQRGLTVNGKFEVAIGSRLQGRKVPWPLSHMYRSKSSNSTGFFLVDGNSRNDSNGIAVHRYSETKHSRQSLYAKLLVPMGNVANDGLFMDLPSGLDREPWSSDDHRAARASSLRVVVSAPVSSSEFAIGWIVCSWIMATGNERKLAMTHPLSHWQPLLSCTGFVMGTAGTK